MGGNGQRRRSGPRLGPSLAAVMAVLGSPTALASGVRSITIPQSSACIELVRVAPDAPGQAPGTASAAPELRIQAITPIGGAPEVGLFEVRAQLMPETVRCPGGSLHLEFVRRESSWNEGKTDLVGFMTRDICGDSRDAAGHFREVFCYKSGAAEAGVCVEDKGVRVVSYAPKLGEDGDRSTTERGIGGTVCDAGRLPVEIELPPTTFKMNGPPPLTPP